MVHEKTNTICVGHNYTQTSATNENKARTLPQTTGEISAKIFLLHQIYKICNASRVIKNVDL
jgi:hypothetical protein